MRERETATERDWGEREREGERVSRSGIWREGGRRRERVGERESRSGRWRE